MSIPKEKPSRDRSGTQARLVEAALSILVEDGSGSLGINAVARRAECDKQLIYRYFGDLNGLIAAMGDALALRMTAVMATHLEPRPASYAEFAKALLRGLIAAYRADPLLARIKAWEWGSSGSDGLTALLRARGSALAAFVAQARPSSALPAGLDVPALNALMVGAVEAAVLASVSTGNLSGMAIQSGADWLRVDAALCGMIDAIYLNA
jgi:AcrR family transcriptional regulator